ncbi:MAG: FkbM family methyltransferase [Phycisphaeraceae bacterium]
MGLSQLIPQRPRAIIKRWLTPTLGARPQVCLPRQTHGSLDGLWCISPRGLSESSIVYSLGVGTDISFDLSLIEVFGLNVWAFDPTPKSLQWLQGQTLPDEFHIVPAGIADYDGEATFAPPIDPQHVSHTMLDRPATASQAITVPVKTLNTIMRELGHSRIDLLKMDIEGAEYAVLDAMLASTLRPAQLLVEFHHRFPGVGLNRTKQALRKLNAAGYRLFHVSESEMEFGFLHESSLDAEVRR